MIFEELAFDVRQSARALRKRPAFAATAIVALALGIGANTAIFSVIRAALFEAPPFRDPNRIVTIWEESSRRPGQHNVVSPANYIRWIERARSFERLAAYVDARANLNDSSVPEEVVVQRVTPDFFRILGESPVVGRIFTDAESHDPQATVVVLGYELWQRRFGGDPHVVGRTIQFNAVPTTIIGIMPAGFKLYLRSGGLAGKPAQLWAPYVLAADARDNGSRSLTVIARLTNAALIDDASAEMSTIAGALATEFPSRDTGWTARVIDLHQELSGPYRQPLIVLGSAVLFVLLIACANVGGLLLARSSERQYELAVRIALGASRWRIVRLLLTEALVLAFLGGVTSLAIFRWTLKVLIALNPFDFMPTIGPSQLVWLLMVTSVVSVSAAFAAGLVPALDGTRASWLDAFRTGAQLLGARRRRRSLQAFLIAEIAICVALLVTAGLLVRSFALLRQVDPGFNTSQLLTFRLQLPRAKYADDASRIRFFEALEPKIQMLPAVHAVGVVSFLPLSGSTARSNFSIEGYAPPAPGQEAFADISVCDNGYLEALGLRVVRGRWFTDRELQLKSNVALISESLARTFFRREDPIGKRLSIAFVRLIVPTEIVGVVSDFRSHDLATTPVPTIFWPHPQLAYTTMTVTVRSAGDPLVLIKGIQERIAQLDRDQPISDVRTMDQWIERLTAQSRFSTVVVGLFSLVAILLVTVGIYGVVSFIANQRRREIGLRIALGASRANIFRSVVLSAIGRIAIGLVIGLVSAIALNRTMAGMLFGVTPADSVTLLAVSLIIGVVAILASVVPALRASRSSPIATLRSL